MYFDQNKDGFLAVDDLCFIETHDFKYIRLFYLTRNVRKKRSTICYYFETKRMQNMYFNSVLCIYPHFFPNTLVIFWLMKAGTSFIK